MAVFMIIRTRTCCKRRRKLEELRFFTVKYNLKKIGLLHLKQPERIFLKKMR